MVKVLNEKLQATFIKIMCFKTLKFLIHNNLFNLSLFIINILKVITRNLKKYVSGKINIFPSEM